MATIIGARVPTAQIVRPDNGLGNVLNMLAQPFLNGAQQDTRLAQLEAIEGKNARIRQAVQAVADPSNPNWNALAAAAVAGDIDPRKGFGNYLLVRNANVHGAADPRTVNAAVGVGENYENTYQGFQDKNAHQLRVIDRQEQTKLNIEQQKPETIVVDGVPTLVPRKDAYNRQASVPLSQVQGAKLQQNWNNLPDINTQQQKAIDALPPADKVQNYVFRDPQGNVVQGRTIDGKTDMTTGQALPAGAQLVNPMNAGGANNMLTPFGPDSTESRNLRSSIQNNQQFIDISSSIIDMVEKSPEIVGPTGVAMRAAKNLTSVANDIGRLFGSQQEFDKQTQNVARDLASKGVNANIINNLSNPDVGNVVRLNYYLAYLHARTFAGQEGREVSNRDFQNALNALGDPNSLLEGSGSYLDGLRKWRDLARTNLEQSQQKLQKGDVRQQTAPTGGSRNIIRKPDGSLGYAD